MGNLLKQTVSAVLLCASLQSCRNTQDGGACPACSDVVNIHVAIPDQVKSLTIKVCINDRCASASDLTASPVGDLRFHAYVYESELLVTVDLTGSSIVPGHDVAYIRVVDADTGSVVKEGSKALTYAPNECDSTCQMATFDTRIE